MAGPRMSVSLLESFLMLFSEVKCLSHHYDAKRKIISPGTTPDIPLHWNAQSISHCILLDMLEENDMRDPNSHKMKLALHHLRDLRQDLEDICTAKKSMLQNVVSLHTFLLEGAESTFMSVTWEKLERAGVKKGYLGFNDDKLAEVDQLPIKALENAFEGVQSRIEEIFSHVCKYYPFGCRMVLDEMLFALADINSFESPETGKRSVAILGKTKLTDGKDKIKLVNPDSGYELGLSNEVDYLLVEYHDDAKTNFPSQSSLQNHAQTIMKHGSSCTLVVELRNEENDPTQDIPTAVGQAIALMQIQKLPEVRFCLSTGMVWIFFVLKKAENGTLECYQSGWYRMDRYPLHGQISRILLILREWGELKELSVDRKKSLRDEFHQTLERHT
ncbi:hypothetical protein Clacol_004393 [Clathrus columnatus]|uniref:Uncharacterized protein n=1 Tax=Clathrus columnatus TaxID=1419009 RepID=A0AAV5A9D0_9AGAM|nr:hypothetical protein Clacol_004393 [Clathrus columnatus]